uniref:YadA-like family protein n=1 Tax=Phascolarctobacterium succinatutens TaxID=626940 RepID=UPI003AF591BA
IKANADAIAANKADADEQHKYLNSRIEHNTACIDKNKVAIENETQARVDADNKLSEAIKTKADAWDTAKKFAAVQEMFNNQDEKNAALDKKNGEQDAAINANGQAIAANKDAIKANADAIAANKADADEQHKYLNSRVEHNTACIDKNKVAIENETQARVDADKALRNDLNQETIDRVDADNRLQTAIDQKADKSTVAENTAAIESNKAAIAQEKKDREHADQKLQDQITINKGQIENEATNRANEDKRIEAKFDGEVSRLDGRIDKLDANVEKVGAMAAAIANLHTMGYDPEAPTEIAVGVGQYRDKTGLALGAFHYPNRDFMLSFSVSTAGDEFMGGVGATWKFGRKSPEELRQAEAEKAAKAKLAKAEAAKKAAKDARVAAQQKRHAEMLAARTGK